MPSIKGVGLRSFFGAIVRLHGPGVIDEMLPHLPEELRRPTKLRSFVSGGWYPLDYINQLHAAAQKATGRGTDLARAIGHDSTVDDFRGVYRVLTFVLSPEFLMKRSPSMFGRYYDTGKLETTARDGFAEARFSGCTGFTHSLWEDITGGCTAILEVCGAKDVVIHATDGGGDKDDHLTLKASWR
jgi:hypothetical protein